MNIVMYLIANKSVEMSKGKFGAQCGHAAVEAYQQAVDNRQVEFLRSWREGGHYTKIVLEADDLAVAERYLNDRGFNPVLIIDEGRTEFDGVLTPTFLGILVDKDNEHTAETFSAFKLYKEPKPPKAPQQKGNRFRSLLP
jgi:peptidyl-tRNA hydrolase